VIGQARLGPRFVMHGYSTLDAEKPRDPAKLIATSKQDGGISCAGGAQSEGRAVPDGDVGPPRHEIYPGKERVGRPADSEAMTPRRSRAGLRQSRRDRRPPKAGDFRSAKAFARAIQTGVADPNPYDGIEGGKLNLWTYDHYPRPAAYG